MKKKLLSNLYVHFASLSFRGSKDNSLKNWIKKYFSYNKTHKVVPGLPDYLKTLQKQVYDDLYKQKKLKVRIISIPEDSQVYFNGKEAGSGNLLITNITPGIHSLTIKREGFTEFGKVLELKENSHPTTVVKTPLLPRESSTYYSFIENNSRNSFAKDPKSGIVNFITKNTGLKTDSADYFLLPLIYPKNKKDLYIFSYAYHSKTNTVIPLKTILAASSISEIAIEYDQVITQVQDHFKIILKFKV